MPVPTFLCGTCLATHHTKSPFAPHHVLPIVALPASEDYTRRLDRLAKSISVLNLNSAKLAQCQEQVAISIDSVIEGLMRYRERLIAGLIEEAVELAVREASECLAQGTEPVSPLANALWVLPVEQLDVVHFAVIPQDLDQFTKYWTTYRNEFERLISSITQPHVPICIESTQSKCSTALISAGTSIHSKPLCLWTLALATSGQVLTWSAAGMS